MDTQTHINPDPDFSPSIPQKPGSEPASKPDVQPVTAPPTPDMPSDDELPVPPIFPTA